MPDLSREEQLSSDSVADQVYERICTLLSSRIWSETETLSDLALAKTLGVSRTPVRNVLARLEGEGLVIHTAGRGWLIRPISVQDIINIFEIKEVLETWAAREACVRSTHEQHLVLQNALQQLDDAAQEGNVPAYMAADDQFHAALFRSVGNPQLARSLAHINRPWHRFRIGYVSQEGLLPVLFREHSRIFEAVSARDALAAEEATRLHLHHVCQSLVAITTRVLLPFMGANETPRKVGQQP
jgi:DNA-binding GntR family transcriptional regulator